jgi:hypothetical protein
LAVTLYYFGRVRDCTTNTVAKKRAGQKDVDADYHFDNRLQGAVSEDTG